MNAYSYVLAGVVLLLGVSSAAEVVQTLNFSSPNGITEECQIISPLPGGDYDKDDHEDEELLCSIDFYDTTSVALCPKTWSTSPGTMLYDITKSNLNQAAYEDQATCGGSKKGHEKLAKFKQTMNQSGTSGTFAPSSLLYYHLSRYFDTAVKVPVAVYRSMDKEEHFNRVTKKAHENGMGKGRMIRAGWKWLYQAEQNPAVYKPIAELFTDDLRQIFGSIMGGGGERYGAEINGVRSSWGDAQNNDFQETPAFLALRSEAPLLEAIQDGLEKGQKDPKVRKAMGGGASDFQMAVWMKELTEIVILDYILSQQDRIGNIDYKWYVYWVNKKGKVKKDKLDSELPRSKMDQIDYPREIDGSPTYLVQRSRINDNDAGGKTKYTNYAKRTQMLEKIRHMSKKTYKLLLALNVDLQNKGPIYSQLEADFHLDDSELEQIVNNTAEATKIVSGLVDAGKIQFDLDSVKTMFESLTQ